MTTWWCVHPDVTVEHTEAPPWIVCVDELREPLKNKWLNVARTMELVENRKVVVPPIVERLLEDYIVLDLGGILWEHRKEYEFVIEDLRIRVPAHQVTDYLELLDRIPEESVDDFCFYGVPTLHWKLLLSPVSRSLLIKEMQSVAAEASTIATIENDHFNKMVENSSHVQAPKRPLGPMGES